MKQPSEPIRRKFILTQPPPSLAALKGLEMEEGFIVSSPLRELRLCRKDKRYLISFREKQLPLSQSQEIKITQSTFQSLWPFTEGKRIKSTRYLFRLKSREVVVDHLLGEHAPLKLIEVFFPTLQASCTFKKPSFFGEEVTGCREYDAEEIALHGVPKPLGICQIGVLPYSMKRGELEVLLVTNSSRTHWIIPKGNQEPEMTPHEVAIMEAMEEGGVLGVLQEDLHLRGTMAHGRFLQIYALQISKLLHNWPEKRLRLRCLVPIEEALRLINDPGMARAVKRLAMQLKKRGI